MRACFPGVETSVLRDASLQAWKVKTPLPRGRKREARVTRVMNFAISASPGRRFSQTRKCRPGTEQSGVGVQLERSCLLHEEHLLNPLGARKILAFTFGTASSVEKGPFGSLVLLCFVESPDNSVVSSAPKLNKETANPCQTKPCLLTRSASSPRY